MALSRFISPFADVGGGIKPASGAKLFFYATGTNTFKNTYNCPDGTTANANPVIADSSGVFPDIFLNGTYKVVLQDKNGAQQWEADPVEDVSTDGGQTLTFLTLADAVASIIIKDGDSIDIKERTSGNAGGAMWDVVLTSTVTPNTFDIVVSTGEPTLSLVLRDKEDPRAWGAVEGGVVDCADAIEAWDGYRKSVIATTQYTAKWPAGKYLFTRGIDFSTTGLERSEIIGGDGFEVVEIICDFNGYGTNAVDDFMLNLGDDDATSYHSAFAMRGFQFTRGPNCDRAPVAIMAGAVAQSRISGITHGSWNNTILRLVSPQNSRIRDYSCFSGGESFEYKDASAVTVQQSGTTLTASSSIFTAADVGHTINIWGISGSTTRRKCKVVSLTSGTIVEVDTSYTDTVDRALYFGSPLVSISSGSTTLTADAPCFTEEHVGLQLWIKNGKLNNRFLREKIDAYISPTQVTLSGGASATITNEEFTVPAVEIYSSDVGGGSDNTYEMQVENHRGVGVCIEDQDIVNFVATKIHGEQSPTSAIYSIAPMWTQQVAGFFQGSFDAQYLGEQRVYSTYQTGCFNFESLSTRSAFDEQLFKIDDRASGFEGGIIQIGDLSISGAASTSEIEDLIEDSNSSPQGYVLSGKVSFNEYDNTRVYTGNSYITSEGVFKGLSEGDISSVTWDGTAPSSGAEKYRWSRTGNIVFFEFRLDYSVAGVTNSALTIDIPSDMPEPLGLSPQANDELHSAMSGYMSDAKNAAAIPGLSKVRSAKTVAGDYQFKIKLNSGTISAVFANITGFYFA